MTQETARLFDLECFYSKRHANQRPCLVPFQIAALGPLIYIPFTGRFKTQYITAVFMGEALAALIPHILGIAEGVLMPSECQDLEVSILLKLQVGQCLKESVTPCCTEVFIGEGLEALILHIWAWQRVCSLPSECQDLEAGTTPHSPIQDITSVIFPLHSSVHGGSSGSPNTQHPG